MTIEEAIKILDKISDEEQYNDVLIDQLKQFITALQAEIELCKCPHCVYEKTGEDVDVDKNRPLTENFICFKHVNETVAQLKLIHKKQTDSMEAEIKRLKLIAFSRLSDINELNHEIRELSGQKPKLWGAKQQLGSAYETIEVLEKRLKEYEANTYTDMTEEQAFNYVKATIKHLQCDEPWKELLAETWDTIDKDKQEKIIEHFQESKKKANDFISYYIALQGGFRQRGTLIQGY